MTDVVFITPNNATATYQSLAAGMAIEPPTWALILAESCRKAGYSNIIDCLAENLSDEEVIKAQSDKPRVICFVVYGQNVNAGTTNMSGAVRLSEAIKAAGVDTLSALLGLTFKPCLKILCVGSLA